MALHLRGNLPCQREEVLSTVGLDVNAHGIAPLEVRQANLVLARELREQFEHLLDLLGEDVDAMNLHHVVAAPHDMPDPRMLVMAAGALAADNAAQVMRAEADERRAFLLQRGQDDFARLAIGHKLAGLGVYELEIQEIAPHVHGIAFLAADADTGTVDLGQAVDVVELDAEQVLDTLAHLVAPALGADDALLELNLVAQAALLDFLAEQQRVARSRTQHRGLEIDHHLDLFLGIAGPHGHRHGAELLAACLEPDSRSPQAVTWRNLHTVFLGDTRVLVAARELRRPVVDVFLGVGDHDRRARRARRRVNAHDFAGRDGNRPERVGRAQV